MSNIEDDIKAKGFIEGYKQIKNNASIIKSIDKDFFFELVDYLLEEREQDKARIKELEKKLEEANKQLDLDYVDENYIPKQKVKEMQTKIKELEEENGKLRIENAKLRVVRVEYEYGYENTHFITKNNLIQIDRNKYLIEVEEGKFVDVKQLYYESIPKQKVKDVVEEAIEIIDSELFKVIMGDVTKVTRLRYLLKNELLEEGE